MTIEYSDREKTIKNKTVKDAINVAELLIRERRINKVLSTDILVRRKLNNKDLLTMVELNELVDDLIKYSPRKPEVTHE